MHNVTFKMKASDQVKSASAESTACGKVCLLKSYCTLKEKDKEELK